MKCSHEYNMLNIVESVRTPVRYKNHTKTYRFNVNQTPIRYKTCDDTIATTYNFC